MQSGSVETEFFSVQKYQGKRQTRMPFFFLVVFPPPPVCLPVCLKLSTVRFQPKLNLLLVRHSLYKGYTPTKAMNLQISFSSRLLFCQDYIFKLQAVTKVIVFKSFDITQLPSFHSIKRHIRIAIRKMLLHNLISDEVKAD